MHLTEYVMTSEKLARLLGKREGIMPACEFPVDGKLCGKPMSECIGKTISANQSCGRMRYFCDEHRIDLRRIE